MKVNMLIRMVLALVISTLSLAGISMAAEGQREPQEEQKRDQHEKQQEQKQQQKEQQRERVQRKSEQEQKQQRVQQKQQDHRQQQKQEQRLSQQQQQKLIRQQRQKRRAQYRYQEEYLEHLRQQQIRLRNERFDYDHDPYFHSAPIYRYNRGGRYYETNEYGAKMLRQAVNYGYEQGYRAGKADRDDRWRGNYKDSYAYRDANYGYSGYYLDRSDYNHYFREGFRRGYEDGYNSRYRYGRHANGHYSMLDKILSQILNFQSIR